MPDLTEGYKRWRTVVEGARAAGAEVRAKRDADTAWLAAATYAQMLEDEKAKPPTPLTEQGGEGKT